MNTDIERIAEKWTAKCGFLPNGGTNAAIVSALRELSSLHAAERERLEGEYVREKEGWLNAAKEQARCSEGHAKRILEVDADNKQIRARLAEMSEELEKAHAALKELGFQTYGAPLPATPPEKGENNADPV